MSPRLRAAVFILGLVLLVISLVALVYAFQGGETVRASATLAPTLFTLPPGGNP